MVEQGAGAQGADERGAGAQGVDEQGVDAQGLDVQELQIRLAEYGECGSLFRDGMKTIMEIVRTFLYVNAILLTAVALVLRIEGSVSGSSFVAILALLGLVASVGTLVTHWRMTQYFRGWLSRANELSTLDGLQVYKTTFDRETAGRKEWGQSYWIMLFSYLITAGLWIYILVSTFGYGTLIASVNEEAEKNTTAVQVEVNKSKPEDAALTGTSRQNGSDENESDNH